MTALRILVGLLIGAAIAVALVPLAVLVDLKEGGTGWGLCPEGLDTCRTSYFAGFELLAGVVVVLFAILALIRICVRLLRRLERTSQPAALASEHPRTAGPETTAEGHGGEPVRRPPPGSPAGVRR